MINLKTYLNSSQFEAVTTINGPVLVIAGAGSGKTRVVEYRTLYLVQNGVNPKSVLLLTFTRRAAREMLSRAAQHDIRCENIEGGTFHSFAYRILKRYGKIIGIPDSFSVLDEGDAEEAIHRCCAKLGFLDKEKRFPKKDTLREVISMSINKNISIEGILEKEYSHFLEYADKIKILKDKYQEYKIDSGYLDYDDLLVYLRLLLENEDIRLQLSEKYKFIMVDEYQDTNLLQGDITYSLAEKHRNIMVVGDDAQSIYGFRGASHKNIMEFPKKFPECKIIKLEENYRSTQPILDVSNVILENMKNKYSKCLVSVKKETGTAPQLLLFKNVYEEAEWIANKVIELREEGINLNHQGILFRSSYISIPLQAELSKRNVPYKMFGGLKFYETAHIKDILSYFKVLVNFKDELAWNRILMFIEGIGSKTCEKFLEKIPGCSDLKEIIAKVIQPYKQQGNKYSEELTRLSHALKTAYDKKLNKEMQFDIIFNYYNEVLKDKFDDWHLRINDLYTLRQVIQNYDSLEELLADFATELPDNSLWKRNSLNPEAEECLTLSTIHSAKGLEWEVVFLIGLIDGVLPVGFALDDEDEIEEEQRLFYVGATRAKSQLILSLYYEGTKGKIGQFNEISRFISASNVLSKLDKRNILQKETYGFPYVANKKLTGNLKWDRV